MGNCWICAQIGKNVHISGGAGIGGVLEPVQAGPVIIEDNCFIGARSEVAEGVVMKQEQFYQWECLLVHLLKLLIETLAKYIGRVPAYSVVVQVLFLETLLMVPKDQVYIVP